MPSVPIALEVGAKRVFAIARDWPGWARSGRSEDTAVEALLEAAPRYAAVVSGSARFSVPRSITSFEVIERLDGNATTDFGAPGVLASFDETRADARRLAKLETILRACWAAFDDTVAEAKGVTLAK